MKTFLSSLLLCFLISTYSFADAIQKLTPQQRARVALALAQAKNCSCGPDCTCTNGECGDINCPTSKKVSAMNCPDSCPCGCNETGLCSCTKSSFTNAVKLARKEQKSVILWIGVTCPAKEKEFSKLVNAYEDKIPAFFNKKAGPPYVIVGKYQDGDFVDWRGFDYIPSSTEVNSVIGPRAVQQEVDPFNPPTLNSAPVIPQQFMMPMPMMMPMMGGGMMGGGCGGGG